MKVLRSGRRFCLWSQDLYCIGVEEPGCNAYLLVEMADLKVVGEGPAKTVLFTCPECGVRTRVPSPPWHMLNVPVEERT